MTWLIKSPLLSLGILVATYGAFGWYVCQSASLYTTWLVEQGESWGWSLESDTVFVGLHILAALVILMITSSLAAPVALITVFFGSGFKSDSRAIFSVLVWSFAAVIILRWITYFLRFLILISAAILGKLELQNQGYAQWQVLLMLGLLSLGGFGLGLLTCYWWGRYLA